MNEPLRCRKCNATVITPVADCLMIHNCTRMMLVIENKELLEAMKETNEGMKSLVDFYHTEPVNFFNK